MEYTQMNKMFQENVINHSKGLQNIMRSMLQNMLDEEFNNFIGAHPYERCSSRNGSRNGSYERQLKTRVGTLKLRVCRDRNGNFRSELFDKYQRSEKALMLSIVEMYLGGVSTRKVSKIVEELCGITISKSQVSDLVCKIDEDIKVWRMRPLDKKYWYLMFDARYEKVRENGCIISKAFVCAIGFTEDGIREVIGTWVINSESFEAWNACFKELKERGLSGVEYVVSDENAGLKAAIKKHFQEAQWQRCQVHFMRNFMSKIPRQSHHEAIGLLKNVFDAPSKETALLHLEPINEWLELQKKENIYLWLEENIEDALAVYSLPEQHRKKMRSTNMLERLNSEFKRRSRVVRIFPNEESCLRLLTAIAIETSEDWSERRYLVDVS